MQSSFDYATIRVVPRVECEEFINVGVVVFCLQRKFLEARVHVDEARLRALWREIDVELVRRHLRAVCLVCSGDPEAGPMAELTQRERFHWVVAPRSTMIQTSAVHTGLTEAPAATLEGLMGRLRGEV
jgi:hypothetical protein